MAVVEDATALPWSRAWHRAAYGPDGFWTTGPGAALGPSAFFRTSVHVGAVFARAVAALLVEVDGRLDHPARLDLVEVAAGRGELVTGVLRALPDDVRHRVRPVAVDVHAAPPDLDARIGWVVGAAPDAVPHRIHGLLVAHEWLDEIPLDIVEVDATGVVRMVLVDDEGRETLGEVVDPDSSAWLGRWWPLHESGARAEVGRPRDEAWQRTVARLVNGTALAVDYGHLATRRPRGGAHPTLTAYDVGGRRAAARPDTSTNLTAHVAIDSVARAVGATVSTQRDALLGLGVSSALPERDLANGDALAYGDALVAASEAAELLDRSGLGAFLWVRVDR